MTADGEAVAAETAAATVPPAESSGPGRSTPATASGLLIEEQLAGISYTGIYDEPVRLTGGAYEGEPFEPGGASRPSVILLPRPRLFADLDGVAGEEAVVLLSGSSGGSGSNLYVAVVGEREGRAVNLGTALVGDRPQVRSMTVDGGRIRLDLVQQGPGDAACCPSRLVARTWSLQGEELAEGEEENLGTLSPAELEGRTWVLMGFDLQEPVPEGVEITAEFAGGQITGSAGCNRYFAAFEETKPGFVKVGPAGATRMMCPGEVMEVEGRYLQRLEGVTRYSFYLGDLILGWQADDAPDANGPDPSPPAPGDEAGPRTGILLFAPAPEAPG
jgi:heat shock protein HslJ